MEPKRTYQKQSYPIFDYRNYSEFNAPQLYTKGQKGDWSSYEARALNHGTILLDQLGGICQLAEIFFGQEGVFCEMPEPSSEETTGVNITVLQRVNRDQTVMKTYSGCVEAWLKIRTGTEEVGNEFTGGSLEKITTDMKFEMRCGRDLKWFSFEKSNTESRM